MSTLSDNEAADENGDGATNVGYIRKLSNAVVGTLAAMAPITGAFGTNQNGNGTKLALAQNGTPWHLQSGIEMSARMPIFEKVNFPKTQNGTIGKLKNGIELSSLMPKFENGNGIGKQQMSMPPNTTNLVMMNDGEQKRSKKHKHKGKSHHNKGLPLSGDYVAHDPTMIQLADRSFVVYSTHNGMEARVSKDMVFWTRNSAVFPKGLGWASKLARNNEFWAPDVSGPYGEGKDKKYWLFYCVPVDGTLMNPQQKLTHTAVIGRAVSSSGRPGTWKDLGRILESNEKDDFNAIDPNLFVDPSTKRFWLQYGSFWMGIFQVELNPKTGALLNPKQKPIHLATRPNVPDHAVEAPFLFKKGNWYYLFVSFDRCCAGLSSTYTIRVGRANSPNGPFKDRNGTPMTQGGGTLLLGANGAEIGPGGQSVMTTADGKDILVYHYYDKNANGLAKLGLRQIKWDNAKWPTV
ncbi:hypothetical protein niasHS_001301 [Heterodera schachtii]|uniref:Endo-1,5-alpha-L-arabinanase A n=1 Tax=Heterodera schachtii TaxID=97005 RepID=A0ABD2KJ00_HETSC